MWSLYHHQIQVMYCTCNLEKNTFSPSPTLAVARRRTQPTASQSEGSFPNLLQWNRPPYKFQKPQEVPQACNLEWKSLDSVRTCLIQNWTSLTRALLMSFKGFFEPSAQALVLQASLEWQTIPWEGRRPILSKGVVYTEESFIHGINSKIQHSC